MAEFVDLFDCLACVNQGGFCDLHLQMYIDQVKAGRELEAPEYLPGLCRGCRLLNASCPKHGGGQLPGFEVDLDNPPKRPPKPRASWNQTVPSKSPDECGYCRRFGKPCARHGGMPSRNYKGEVRIVKPANEPTDERNIVRHSKKGIKASLNTPQMPKNEGFRDAFKAVLIEILLERYADQVTAKEVMDRLEAE